MTLKCQGLLPFIQGQLLWKIDECRPWLQLKLKRHVPWGSHWANVFNEFIWNIPTKDFNIFRSEGKLCFGFVFFIVFWYWGFQAGRPEVKILQNNISNLCYVSISCSYTPHNNILNRRNIRDWGFSNIYKTLREIEKRRKTFTLLQKGHKGLIQRSTIVKTGEQTVVFMFFCTGKLMLNFTPFWPKMQNC